MNINLSFSQNNAYWIIPIFFIGWILIHIYCYKTLPRYAQYKNFIYYLYANEDEPFNNFVNSFITLCMVIWIIRLIYTIIYGFQPC